MRRQVAMRWVGALAVAAMAVVTAPMGYRAVAETLVADDFEYFPAHSGVHAVSPPGGKGHPLKQTWDLVVWWHQSNAIQIVCDGTAASGNCHLRENFLPGHEGASELRDHADEEPTRWTPPSEEVWVRHFVRFPEGWEWPPIFYSLKFGRLRVARSCGAGPCIESYWAADGPSMIRWTYAYQPGPGKEWCCGSNRVSAAWPGGFRTNRWYCLELHVKQNTRLSPPNGLMELYIDGELRAANRLVDTRGSAGPGEFAWRIFNISDNFTGRGSVATAKTPYIAFDSVVLSTERVPCGRPAPADGSSGKKE